MDRRPLPGELGDVTGLSDRDPLHKLPVVEQLEAALYTDALVTLAPTRTLPPK